MRLQVANRSLSSTKRRGINCSAVGMYCAHATGTDKSKSQRWTFTARFAVFMSVAGSFVACGSSMASSGRITTNGGTSASNGGIGASGSTSTTITDGGSTVTCRSIDAAVLSADVGIVACDHYFDANYSRCGGPVLPAAEMDRIRARFQQICASQLALPGSGVTEANLEACASALDVSACQFPAGQPIACDFHGTLLGGATCTDNVQCVSGQCQGTQLFSPDGPVGPVTYGTCAPVVAVGQVCAQGSFSAGCPQGAVCITADTTGSTLASCVEVAQGDVGATCDDLSAKCKPGLYCAGETCAPLAGSGAACGDGPSRWPGGCVAPYGCGDTPSTCRSGSTGATCVSDQECAPGLGCIPGPCSGSIARIGCSAYGQCAAISWAAPEQPCSDLVRCLVGSCVFVGTSGPGNGQDADGGLAAGTCPTVVPDGQPCTVASTCDTFSQCFQGKCTLLDGVVCE